MNVCSIDGGYSYPGRLSPNLAFDLIFFEHHHHHHLAFDLIFFEHHYHHQHHHHPDWQEGLH
jgi:hypothetical protein